MVEKIGKTESTYVDINELLKGSQIELIIFDKDGTIVVAEENHYRAWAHAYSQCGSALSLEEYIEKGMARTPLVLMNATLPGRTQEEYENILKIKEAEYQRIVEEEGIQPVAGFIEMFKRLKQESNRKFAVASSDSKESIWDNLQRIGLITPDQNPFISLVSVKEVEHGKPSPDIFLEAMNRANIKDPSNVVVFEDAVSGVLAAKAAGMICVALANEFVSAEKLKDAGADLVIQNFSEILPEETI